MPGGVQGGRPNPGSQRTVRPWWWKHGGRLWWLGFFLSHGFPSPRSSGERQGLGALRAFQGMCLHFAKDVLEAAQVRHQYRCFENLQELFPLLSLC